MDQFLLLILLLATVVVAAYFYLKRRQQHIHVDATGDAVEHRHERDPSDRAAHDHDPVSVDTTSVDATRDR